MTKQESIDKSYIIHSLIGIGIMILFPLLSPFPYVTETGMEILGIFLGTIYLWTFVETLWSSLLSILMVGLSSFASMDEVLSSYLGNPTVIIVMFMFFMSGALEVYKITDHIAHFFLTRKITNGKPWLFIFIIGIACILLGGFSSPFTAILVFWPIMGGVLDQLGYSADDEFNQLVKILIVVAALIGFPITPFMQNGLVLIQNFANITAYLPEGPIIVSDMGYLSYTMIISFVIWVAIILFTKYVLKPDSSKLEQLDISYFEKNKPKPMDLRQKTIAYGFLAIILLMLVPSIFPTLPGMEFLKTLNFAIPAFITTFLCMVILTDNKPVMDLKTVANQKFIWDSFFIVCTAIYIGNVLTDPSTGITEFINWGLSPILAGMSPMIFTIVIVLMSGILTNIGNSLVVSLILQTIVLSYYISNPSINVLTINTLVIYFSLASAIVLPSASPFSALMYGHPKIEKSLIQKVTPLYVTIEFIVIILSIPLANILMNIFS